VPVCIPYTTDTVAFQVGVIIEEPFPMLALDALCKQLHEGIKDVMAVQNSVHSRLVAKTTKDLQNFFLRRRAKSLYRGGFCNRLGLKVTVNCDLNRGGCLPASVNELKKQKK
jgi:hypothetical protein